MANLNIPFLLLQEGACKFSVDASSSRLVSQSRPDPNLLVLTNDNGCLTLCHQDSVLTRQPNGLVDTKFAMSIRPRTLCVPSIFPAAGAEADGRVLDHCLIKSPASQILSTSDSLLVTAHEGGTLRLWSTSDGRCIIRSPSDLFAQGQEPKRLYKLGEKAFPGLVLCVCDRSHILVINMYTMTLVKVIQSDHAGLEIFKVRQSQNVIEITIVDSESKIVLLTNNANHLLPTNQDSSRVEEFVIRGTQPASSGRTKQPAFRQCSSLMLGQCNDSHSPANQSILDSLNFKPRLVAQGSALDPESTRQRGRGAHRAILQTIRITDEEFLLVFQDRIESVIADGDSKTCTTTLVQYEQEIIEDDGYDFTRKTKEVPKVQKAEKWYISAQYMPGNGKGFLMCIDNEFKMIVYQNVGSVEQRWQEVLVLDIFDDARLYNLVAKHVDEGNGLTLLQSQEELMKKKLMKLKRSLVADVGATRQVVFTYCEEQSLLYTYTTVRGLGQDISTMITWSLESLFQKLVTGATKELQIPVHANDLDFFGSTTGQNQAKDPNCILNINQFVAKNYFSRHQHSFFYCDEKVTDQAFYTSSDFPSMVLGTNYGRIFIVQLFQDIEGRAYPVVVIDSHNASPITCLYIAYSSARRGKQPKPGGKMEPEQRDLLNLLNRAPSSHASQAVTLDSGGHLIACSEDGSISVTNMNSADIVNKLANFSITRNDREKGRIDDFMKERESNLRSRRRQSVTQFFTTERYFNLVRAHPFKVFQSCSFGRISRVVEVQILQQGQLERQKHHQQAQSDGNRMQSTTGPDGSAGAGASPGAPSDASGSGMLGNTRFKSENTPTHPTEHSKEQTAGIVDSAYPGAQGSNRANQHHYQHHLQSMRDLSGSESLASTQQSPLLNELMPFQASYACLDTEHDAMYILQLQNGQCEMLKIHGLDSTPIGVYEDALQNVVHVITEKDLNVYSYNKRSKQLVRKSNFAFAQSTLQMNQTIQTLTEKQQHFKQAGRLAQHSDSTHSAKYDQYSFSQQFQDRGRAGATNGNRTGASLQAGGHHKVLDYLSLSLSLPLYYHPHNLLSQKFTKTVKDLLPYREKLRGCLQKHGNREQEMAAVKDGLRRLIKSEFIWNDRYKSDFSQEYYQAQGAVTPLLTGNGPVSGGSVQSKEDQESFRQQMIVINTKDMISVFKSRMKVLTESLGRIRGSQAPTDASGTESEDPHGNLTASPPRDSSPSQPGGSGQSPAQGQQPNISADYFQNSKWPTRLLALVHPFTLDENLDENLELFFGLSIPFVDFRIGVQGADEAFSFVIARDEKDKEDKPVEDQKQIRSDSWQLDESIKLLKLGMIEKRLSKKKIGASKPKEQSPDLGQDGSAFQANRMAFVNSEYWKASSYMSSIMSSFFLSTLVSIVEYAQPDITTLMQDWLNVVQYITSSSSHAPPRGAGHSDAELDTLYISQGNSPKPLSVSAISQLMLRKDHSISSCARDVIMKPLLSSGSSIEHIKAEIDEWQDLIMDTYLKLKEDSGMRTQSEVGATGAAHQGPRQASSLHSNSDQTNQGQPGLGQALSGQSHQIDQRQAQSTPDEENARRAAADDGTPHNTPQRSGHEKSVNHFFGELEIRGLVNLSYYALYSQDGPAQFRVDTDVQNRLCKCTVILTREIMTKFTANSKEHANLLTILMQLLQTQMRAQVPTFKTKVIKEDVIKILLLIYDFYKKQLRDERFLTRVVAENFHLIHPKNSELYLKLTAAKTLLEIGTYFTEDFLLLIHEQATTLKDGPEYQRNVLDVLRYFINGSRDGLEPYLIQIVQTLLKCLDPNDEQLRKNSTQLISIILSTMVKSFPMIAFHHETQRLAVGTPTGPIAIYDVRTSAKWKILEGHVKNVSCVEFDQKGNMLASYSALDLTLRLWKVGNAGFFSTIMGGTGKSAREIKLQPLEAAPSERDRAGSRGGRRQSERGGQGQGLPNRRGSVSESKSKSQGQSDGSHRCKVRFVNADKAVELVREDGTVEFHRLAK